MSKKHHRGGLPWLFNPFEIAFSAYSGSGKTTLICKLIQEMEEDYAIAYAKSDAHRYELDREGKDTFNAQLAGAQAAVINNADSRARMEGKPADEVWRSLDLLEYDLVFIEGYKNETKAPRIILLNEQMLSELEERDLTKVIAFVGPDADRPAKTLTEKTKDTPYFQRDAITAIAHFISAQLEARIPKLKGLVLTGGFSRRMGRDKAAIEYHGKSMARHAHDLLSPFCEEVLLSVRDEDQQMPSDCDKLPRLADKFVNLGPAGGIMSALTSDRNTAWLVMGCDLPLVNGEALSTLLEARNPFKYASSFISASDGMPEPLLSVYEPKALSRFLQYLAMNRTCPRKLLLNSPVELIPQGDTNWLDNINTPEDEDRVRTQIQKA